MSKEIDKIYANDPSFDIYVISVSKHFMEPVEFRKLNVRLPRQPLVNQRPWWIAGLLLAFVILLFAAWSYYAYKKRLPLPEKQEKTALDRAGAIKRTGNLSWR